MFGWRWWPPRWPEGKHGDFTETWWKQLDQREQTQGIDSVRIQFPIRKLENESAWLQSRRLRKRA
jgi:hypothetical protein